MSPPATRRSGPRAVSAASSTPGSSWASPWRSDASDRDEPLADALGDRLHPVGDLELLVDVLEVGADGGLAQPEELGGLGVREPLGDELEDLGLPLREGTEDDLLLLRQGGLLGGRDPEVAQQPPREVRLDHRAARADLTDGLGDALGGHALEQVAR